ncbi:unnamed protein product [Ceratitis capitata]|uniref:(Mediterranean fruit fly) hypothetical protein n=1 Tax=Ceratitis capitata TaxID=7213 RepID=A0A811UE62_CERCA|nr:unnamed protein product [Ceratitis capitata]
MSWKNNLESCQNRIKRAAVGSSSDELDSEEEDRLKDLNERDEFAERLKKRDEGKVRKLLESSSSRKAIEEAAKRLKLDMKTVTEFYHSFVCNLAESIWKNGRKISLTAREREEREYKKQLLQIAKEHERARELERIQRYHIPQNLKKGEKEEYVEVDELEKQPNSETEEMGSRTVGISAVSIGSKDAKIKEEYDLLLEDQIELYKRLRWMVLEMILKKV